MRALPLTTALGLAMLSTTALAQPQGAATPAQQQNPLVATVDRDQIHLLDVENWINSHVPPEQRNQIPQEKLVAIAMDNVVSGKALQVMAHKEGLDKDPQVAKQMQEAANEVLQRALLIKTVKPEVTEDAIKAAYDKEYAGKPGEEEVHARHILVDSQAKAQDIIKQLEAGAKFEELAKKYGDPKDAATQQGGDLGYFKKGDMLPEFSDAAFKLNKGEYTKTPVHTKYGWHVIQVLDKRTAAPPSYDQVHDQIQQQLTRQDAMALVQKARSEVKITQYGPDGKPLKPGTPSGASGKTGPASSKK